MGAIIQWCNKEKTVLYCAVKGRWHPTRFYTTLQTLWQGVAITPHRVDLIIDLNHLDLTDEFIPQKDELLPSWCPGNLGTVVVVGHSGPIYEVYGAFMWHRERAYLSVEVRAMSNPKTAYDFLIRQRARGTEPA